MESSTMESSYRPVFGLGWPFLFKMALSLPTFAVFLARRGLSQYLDQHFFDKTFRGIYQANAFDMALLIPYFVVLILLASYGMHRYTLVYLYYKKKKNRIRERVGKVSNRR